MSFLFSLLGIGRMIRSGIGAGFAWATANVARMLAIGLALALAWGYVEHRSAAKWKRVLASTETAYRTAQMDAKRAQDALNARHIATNEAVNKGSTDDHAKGLDAARTAVADYTRMHPAPRCAPGQTKPATVSGDPGMAAGTSPETGMASIAVADLDTLAAGTVRAESCRAWGQSLIDAGLAVSGN